MTINGVTFNVALCSQMSREEFVSQMMPVFWQDMGAKERKAALGKAYTLIVKAAGKE